MSSILMFLIYFAFVLITYLLICTVYTIIITSKQTKKFIQNLKIGEQTKFGTIEEVKEDYVIIKAKVEKQLIEPPEIKSNSIFFLK